MTDTNFGRQQTTISATFKQRPSHIYMNGHYNGDSVLCDKLSHTSARNDDLTSYPLLGTYFKYVHLTFYETNTWNMVPFHVYKNKKQRTARETADTLKVSSVPKLKRK